MIAADRCRFLNHEATIAGASAWDDPSADKLWRYNLHYFDDLNASDGDTRNELHRALIDRWVVEVPAGKGTGWEPYPTALRIVNWIKWTLAGHALQPQWQQSLAIQTRWLMQRIEWHLLGNHLFADAKALVFSGLFFDGAEASSWLEKGLTILDREIPEQFLKDGGQFERSPMYHAQAVEDLLDLINIARAFDGGVPKKWRPLVESWPSQAERSLACLAALCHPDGDIAFFNDAALGIALRLSDLKAYADRLGLVAFSPPRMGMQRVADSGYIRIENESAVALLDVAPVGPDYIPGHAHADTLSFELSLFGRRVLVNSGTSIYGTSPERLRQRGTAAHNTVTVNGENSSEVWSGFRVARRAYPHSLVVLEDESTITVACSHNGYKRLPGKPEHRREWQFSPSHMKVVDTIFGRFREAVGRFHFHPDATPEIKGDREGVILLPGGRRARWKVSGGAVAIVPSTYHPEFGLSIPNKRLEVRFEQPRTAFVLNYSEPGLH